MPDDVARRVVPRKGTQILQLRQNDWTVWPGQKFFRSAKCAEFCAFDVQLQKIHPFHLKLFEQVVHGPQGHTNAIGRLVHGGGPKAVTPVVLAPDQVELGFARLLSQRAYGEGDIAQPVDPQMPPQSLGFSGRRFNRQYPARFANQLRGEQGIEPVVCSPIHHVHAGTQEPLYEANLELLTTCRPISRPGRCAVPATMRQTEAAREPACPERLGAPSWPQTNISPGTAL